MATDVSKNVIQLHGEDDQQKNRPIVPIVCHVAKMAERASEKSEAEHTQANALDVALGLIGDQPPSGNQRDSQRKECDEKSIPVNQRRESDQENTGYDD